MVVSTGVSAAAAGPASPAAARPLQARTPSLCEQIVNFGGDDPLPPHRKAWIAPWTEGSRPPDLTAAVTGVVDAVLGERAGSVLVVATDPQLDALAGRGLYSIWADELDQVSCGSLGYRAGPDGPVAPAPRLPASWRARGPGRDYWCVQLTAPPPDDGAYADDLAAALGRDDASLPCDATCTIALTAREAAALAGRGLVRGVWRREPAFKLDSSLVCPHDPELEVPPALWPAFLAAVAARPGQRLRVVIRLDGGDHPRAAARAAAAIAARPRVRVRERGDHRLVVELARRDLAAVAALPAVWTIALAGEGYDDDYDEWGAIGDGPAAAARPSLP